MKTVMLVFFVFVFSFLNAQEEVSKKLGDYDELKVFDKIKVELIKSTENKIEVTGIKKREVDIVLNNNILKIRMSLDNIWDDNNTKVIIYYTDLTILDVNEGSVIKVKETMKANKLEFRAQEGGRIFADIETGLLYAKSVTGGEIIVSGKVNEQDINVKAGGQYSGKKLKSDTAQVKVSAGGKAEVNVKDYIKANTTAGGTIKIYGNPKEIDGKKVLGGRIIEVN